MRKLLALLSVMLILSTPAAAQEDDKGYITRLLESSLAGEGRTVQINGFKGALSRRATVASIVILDAEGQWLRLDNIALQLNRSALLRGRVEIEELSAETIDLSRAPIAPESELPPAEAQGFSLPELPVSIDIKALKAGKIILGEPVLGERAELNLTAALSLISGEAQIKLSADRIDGKRGTFDIDASFQGDDQIVALNIDLDEGEGGIAARLLGLPGSPSTKLAIAGSGPLDDLETQITIATDSQERLSGTVRLTADADANRRFDANIGGDITALFAPQYRPFFGDAISLNVEGQQNATGELELSSLNLKTEALVLKGSANLNKDYWPTQLDVSGRIGNDAQTLVTLPVSGDPVKLRQALLSVQFDQTEGNKLSGTFEVADFETTGVQIKDTTLTANGTLDGKVNAIGQVSAALDLLVSGISLDDPALMAAAGDTIKGKLNIDFIEGQPLNLSELDIAGSDFKLAGNAVVDDLTNGLKTEFDTTLTATDISRFSALAGSNLNGAVEIALAGTSDLGGEFDITLSGEANDLKVGQEQADQLLRGKTNLALEASRDSNGTRIESVSIENPQLDFDGSGLLTGDGADLKFKTKLVETAELSDMLEGAATVEGTAQQRDGQWSVDVDGSGPFGAVASIDGLVTGPDSRITFDTTLPDIAPFAPGYTGATNLKGQAFISEDGWNIDTDVAGPYGLTAMVEGLVTGPNAEINFDTTLPNIEPFAPGYRGAVNLKGIAFASPDGWNVDTNMAGPYNLSAAVKGLVTGTNATVEFNANLPNINPLVPQYSGAASIRGVAKNSTEGWRVDTSLGGPYNLTAQVNGRVTGDSAPDITYSANLPNIAPLVPKISGPLSLDGSVNQITPDLWDIATNLVGPAGTQATITGNARASGNLDLAVTGSAPLALADPFIAPRTMSGSTRFNLRVNGPPNLSSVSGTISALDGRFSDPNLQIALENIAAEIGLSNEQANIDLRGQVSSGGTIAVNGGLGLTDSMAANLQITLANLVLEDPELYRTQMNGDISVVGPLLSNARISGQIDIGETLVSVPSSGVSSFGTIPNISHVDAPSPVTRTRQKAGLIEIESKSSGGGGAAYPLNITISAPQKIFVRGRGLDAELGGQLLLTGTTANIISSGRFELVRGRLDILSKRFDLDEGVVQLQGDFDPFLRFVATTTTTVGTASVIVEGSAANPEVRFESSPEAPQDEVLAQIFFGRDVSQISALQALQLASAVATLAGSSGEGVVSKLRRGFDLDDLDITTDDQGNAGLRAGKYISDNIYTDVTVGTRDNAEASLNIDLTPAITAKGKLRATGDTSIGFHFEKDY